MIQDLLLFSNSFHLQVMEQGSLIQVIEYETESALHNVDKGADQLEKARELQIKALKKKTCILIWLSIILAVLILILLFSWDLKQ